MQGRCCRWCPILELEWAERSRKTGQCDGLNGRQGMKVHWGHGIIVAQGCDSIVNEMVVDPGRLGEHHLLLGAQK